MSNAGAGSLVISATRTGRKAFGAVAARLSTADAILLVIALLFGWATLTFPFGSDQGLYAYVAREWVQRGAIPYRDVFDHKTPGIYVLHALTVILFGSNQWGIRVAELLGVLGLGFVASRFATERGRLVRPGHWGLGALAASVFYFGFFDYWSSAQSEIWYTTLGLAAIVAVRRIERAAYAQLAGGTLGAAAMIMKPSAIWFAFLAAALVLSRERDAERDWPKRAFVGLVRYGSGFAAVFLVMLGYFGAHHALPAMFDIVVGANGFYVAHERGVHSLQEVAARIGDFYWGYAPFSPLLIGAIGVTLVTSFRTRNTKLRDRYLVASATCVAGFAAVAMQQKFYWLHWAVMVGPLCGLWAVVADDLAPVLQRHVRTGTAVTICAATLLYGFASTSAPGAIRPWIDANRRSFDYLTGKMTRDEYTRGFAMPGFYYFYHDIEDTGRWLNESSSPSDTVAVRGFNPEVYIVARRHYAGRFFWTNFLVGASRAYRRETFLEEDRKAMEESRPRFIVANTDMREGLESPDYYKPLGYETVRVFGKLTVLERRAALPMGAEGARDIAP